MCVCMCTHTQTFINSTQNNEVTKEGEWTRDGVEMLTDYGTAIRMYK